MEEKVEKRSEEDQQIIAEPNEVCETFPITFFTVVRGFLREISVQICFCVDQKLKKKYKNNFHKNHFLLISLALKEACIRDGKGCERSVRR